jgi:hypothetical protein
VTLTTRTVLANAWRGLAGLWRLPEKLVLLLDERLTTLPVARKKMRNHSLFRFESCHLLINLRVIYRLVEDYAAFHVNLPCDSIYSYYDNIIYF